MVNQNQDFSNPLDASMQDVIATLEQVRDEWTNMAIELRDLYSTLDSLECHAAIDSANALISRVNHS